MQIAGSTAYGGFVDRPESDLYTVRLTANVPGQARPSWNSSTITAGTVDRFVLVACLGVIDHPKFEDRHNPIDHP